MSSRYAAREKTMNNEVMTIEQIDRHLESTPAPGSSSGGTGAAALPNFCELYKRVRPILVLAADLLKLFKPKWAEAIRSFIAGADLVCPTG